MKYLLILILILFNACSIYKSNLVDISLYHPVRLSKSPHSPSKEELTAKNIRVIVLDIDDSINEFAKKSNIGYSLKDELSSKLQSMRSVKVIERFKKTTNIEEQGIYERIKKYKDDIGTVNADYRIEGKITLANQKQQYHQSERGSSAWVSYGVCVAGNIKFFYLKSAEEVFETFHFNECLYERQNVVDPRAMRNSYPELLVQTVPEIIDFLMPKIAKVFKPRGYIESMRIDGDKKIIKTTLNRTLGAVEGRKVEIVKIEKEKNLSGGEDIIEIPIGSGTISDIITDSYSFVTVDEIRGEIHRGDVVRVVN